MFESVVKERERHNSKFAFLFGGPYYAYYQHKLLELRAQLTVAPLAPLGGLNTPLAPLGHNVAAVVPPSLGHPSQVPGHEHDAELQHLLQEFSVSKQSSAVCAWLTSHSAALSASLELIKQQIERAPDDEHALHYMYLLSDLLQQR